MVEQWFDAAALRAAEAAKEVTDAEEHELILAADPDAPIGEFYRGYGMHVLETQLERLEGRQPGATHPAEQS